MYLNPRYPITFLTKNQYVGNIIKLLYSIDIGCFVNIYKALRSAPKIVEMLQNIRLYAVVPIKAMNITENLLSLYKYDFKFSTNNATKKYDSALVPITCEKHKSESKPNKIPNIIPCFSLNKKVNTIVNINIRFGAIPNIEKLYNNVDCIINATA